MIVRMWEATVVPGRFDDAVEWVRHDLVPRALLTEGCLAAEILVHEGTPESVVLLTRWDVAPVFEEGRPTATCSSAPAPSTCRPCAPTSPEVAQPPVRLRVGGRYPEGVAGGRPHRRSRPAARGVGCLCALGHVPEPRSYDVPWICASAATGGPATLDGGLASELEARGPRPHGDAVVGAAAARRPCGRSATCTRRTSSPVRPSASRRPTRRRARASRARVSTPPRPTGCSPCR